MANTSSPSRLGVFIRWAALAVVIATGIYLVWRWTSGPDMTAALKANQQGVGHMDQYKYPEAVAAFEEVVKVAPDWTPGKINLGIALLNLARGQSDADRDASNDRALALFKEVLAKEPDNPYANFCQGIVLYEAKSEFKQAEPYFRKVTEIDPDDPAAWCWLGLSLQDDPAKALDCFQKAVDLDPNLSAALHNLQSGLAREGRPEEAAALSDRLEALKKNVWANHFDPRYNTDLGKYALVIDGAQRNPKAQTGPLPPFQRGNSFEAQLRDGAKWATAAALGDAGPIRKRFGGTMVVLDYNGDNKPDLFLAGAVVDGGMVTNLLLRNDGEGRFTDVTAEAGLAGFHGGVGCSVADFDNDSSPDLLLTTANGLLLFRNDGKGKYEDVTKKAGLADLKSACLGATFVDLDQDGDLDLLVAQHRAGLAAFLNVGEARAANAQNDPPPLNPAFRRTDKPGELIGEPGPVVAVAVSDLDLDQDLDLLVLADDSSPAPVLNDRLLRFLRPDMGAVPAGKWNGALVLDLNNDERSDLLLLSPDEKPTLLVRKATPLSEKDPAKWYEVSTVESPVLVQAQAIDMDLDGRTDVVGLSKDGKPVLLHNDGSRLVERPKALGRDEDWPADVVAVVSTDADGDGNPDVLVWSHDGGLQMQQSKGNGNRGLKLRMSGHRRDSDPAGGLPVRCNADGIGVRASAMAGEFFTTAEYTTLSAGLGQSHQPLVLGVGKRNQADLVRLRWPDVVWQAEFNVAAASPGDRDFGVMRLEESNRKETSCPVLFTWNGERFVFVTDFLGAGNLGESLPEGGNRKPRPEESLKIEADQLRPRDGRYVLKVAEPMSEVTYLDRLQLVVTDHPAGVRVYPDERFAAGGPPPTQELLAFREEVFPASARDHRGNNLTATLRAWDRDTADRFGRRAWIGFAEEHAVELDFGDRLARFGPKDRLVLFLAGWTDYPYPESIWAARQAGVELLPPVLERRTDDGRWEKVADAGFPAGLPRMMTLDVTGRLAGPRCVVRLRTNMHVFWDQVFVAPLLEAAGAFRPTPLEVADATLGQRGLLKEFSPDGRDPMLYDYDRLDSFPVGKLSGRLTRFGDVAPLLGETDDRFVIFGPGDDLAVRFDASKLPPLPDGWERSFVLRTWGYCKDCAPFTATGGAIEPLPFRAMSNYPYGPDEKHPDPGYDRKWNTRLVGPRR
jgi:tetratricopeptide (TPR) repeat protein